MNESIDLTSQDWTLSGWHPHLWQVSKSMELGERQDAEIKAIPVAVPGSVQLALKNAGIIPDWNYGVNARQCEWVENRHWIYKVEIPDGSPADDYDLVCEGLDYSGWILLDKKIIGEFCGSFHPISLPLKLSGEQQNLEIVFDLPPRWLGQFGWSSKISEMKPRFYYTWDWVPRLVQTGITGAIYLRHRSAFRLSFSELWSGITGNTGMLRLRGNASGGNEKDYQLNIELYNRNRLIREEQFTLAELEAGITMERLPVEFWWPSGQGAQPLYDLQISCRHDEQKLFTHQCRLGFRAVTWTDCRNAPPHADPWICEVNGQPIFIQGINWTPIRPNYADVPEAEYRKRIEKYRAIGINLFRVWGGAALEKECFYDLCDEYGIMVWQEFPLSSSGMENVPPSDQSTMDKLLLIADHYLDRLTSHPSLIIWCGGNELQRDLNGNPYGCGKPCTMEEPLLKAFGELVSKRDPNRRYVPASSSGPRFCADENEYGQGLHWDVHGPWKVSGPLNETWQKYWDNDDALFRSEIGCPGASPAALIRKYAEKNMNQTPGLSDNPLWRYPLGWWNEVPVFIAEHGHEPSSPEEYVDWNQQRQATVLRYAAASCKARFPACGGIIIWMGHDCFPISANTAILDFDGEYKPAALALKEVFLGE